MPTHVLIVEAEPNAREFSAGVLREMGLEVHAAASAAQALTVLEKEKIAIMLADAHIPSLEPPELLRLVKQERPGAAVITVTAPGAVREAADAMALGAADFLMRPFLADDLRQVVRRQVAKQFLAAQARAGGDSVEMDEGFQNLVVVSPKMRDIYRLVLKVAAKRCPVLILGESGTGKELVARAIHAHSPWRGQPFVPVDCGALTPTLIESELFGHVRGAFTGANQSRQGLLATAGEGTVLLDEIGELSLELQAKLLRSLQEKEFRPVGSNLRVRLDARIVAATNQDLQAAVAHGTFRKDLYYRLNVVTIRIPPLRERSEDIPPLVEHFLTRYREPESEVAGISETALARLLQYPWPGNVRELENCIQRALAVGAGPMIQVGELSSNVLNYASDASKMEDLATLQRMERRAILQALESTGGDRVRAARLLGIGKSTIYRKLKEYGLDETADSSASPPQDSLTLS